MHNLLVSAILLASVVGYAEAFYPPYSHWHRHGGGHEEDRSGWTKVKWGLSEYDRWLQRQPKYLYPADSRSGEWHQKPRTTAAPTVAPSHHVVLPKLSDTGAPSASSPAAAPAAPALPGSVSTTTIVALPSAIDTQEQALPSIDAGAEGQTTTAVPSTASETPASKKPLSGDPALITPIAESSSTTQGVAAATNVDENPSNNAAATTTANTEHPTEIPDTTTV